MKSLSEIDTVSKRASRAAGFDWGIAEEVGKNTRTLEMLGISGIKNLNYYFKIRSSKNFENIKLLTKENKKTQLEYCPIIAGVNFLDQVRSLENLNEIKFQNIAFPILFLPFISRASEIVGKKILLKIDNRDFLLNYNNSIYSNSLDNGIITIGNIIVIKFLNNIDSFKENEWKELYKLSENTFVEENDSLKQSAAGAGLNDND
jgi:predicted transcriptional regulator|tara:strand:+ start:9 stop:620 length:612 start_codon:yes stop_codon:yes gene_type:complete